jgi:hypothetical protein
LQPRYEKSTVERHHSPASSATIIGVSVQAQRLGLDVEVLDAGCCGLAGSFGYQPGEPYDVSLKAGERILLPAVRAAAPETLIVTDGFSCRSQIEHGSDRSALHLAQVVQAALRGDGGGPYPERAVPRLGGALARRR